MAFKTAIAEKNDLSEIADLVNSAYRGDSSRKGWTTEADLLDGQRTDAAVLLEEISSTDFIILCFRDALSEKLKGCVSLTRFQNGNHINSYLGMLTIDPESQGSGLGKTLLDEAEKYAHKEWNSTRMIMTVIPLRKELMDWYKRRGYTSTGETKPFPYGDERFGLPKVDNLHFLVLEKQLP